MPGAGETTAPYLTNPELNRAVKSCEGLQLAGKTERQRHISVYVSGDAASRHRGAGTLDSCVWLEQCCVECLHELMQFNWTSVQVNCND